MRADRSLDFQPTLLRSALRVLTVIVLLAFAGAAKAQSSRVEQLNSQAMEAYTMLELERSQSLLQDALSAAQGRGVGARLLAQTYLNLGTVTLGGFGNRGEAIDYFVRALQADSSVRLDPMTSTPDIQAAFSEASERARSQPAPAASSSGSSSRASSGGSGEISHEPPVEQAVNTPVPVYVEVPGSPSHVYVYYRGGGLPTFRRAEMSSVGSGYGYEIPCSAVFSPDVSYYIVVEQRDGSMERVGSAASPMRVRVVNSLSGAPPSLPGMPPSTPCGAASAAAGGSSVGESSYGESSGSPSSSSSYAANAGYSATEEVECPPGIPDCAPRGSTPLGGRCYAGSDCESGNCDNGYCAASQYRREGAGRSSPPNFFVRVGIGVGLAVARPGLEADRYPCDPDDDPGCVGEQIDAWSGAGPARALTQRATPENEPDRQYVPIEDARAQGYEPAAYSRNAYQADFPTGDPDVDNATEPQLTDCLLSDANGNGDDNRYCLYVATAGLVPNFQIRAEVGYFFWEWLGASLMTRFQPLSGRGALSFMLIGARVHARIFDEPFNGDGDYANSVYVHAHVGGSVGQIQVTIPNAATPQAPWGQSGMGGLHAGVTSGVRFTENFGAFGEFDLMFQIPAFLFNMDLTLGAEVVF